MNKKRVIIIAVIILTVIITSIMLIFFKTGGESNTYAEDEDKILYSYYTGEAFITNIKDSKKFVKASVVLELDEEEILLTMEKFNYIIRDTIIKVLRSKIEEDYFKPDIQEELREKIRIELNNQFITESITKVYFLEFVVQ